MVHVIPLNDLRPHVESVHCQCLQKVEGGVAVHNLWDGREIFEQAIVYACSVGLN